MSNAPLNYETDETPLARPRRSVTTWAQLLFVWIIGLAMWIVYLGLFTWLAVAILT